MLLHRRRTSWHSAKQKAADAAAVAKGHVQILKAKAQEKAEQAAAPTKEGREIAHERRKVKEAEAKMKMHALCGLGCDHPHHHGGGYQQPVVGSAFPPTGAAYPPGGYPPGWTTPK